MEHDEKFWTARVDEVLAQIREREETTRGAAKRLGISAGTLLRWRGMREKGEPVEEVREPPKSALLRASTEHEPNGVAAVHETHAPYRVAIIDPKGSADFRARMNRADGIADLWERALEREGVAAAYRARALELEGVAAVERARAIAAAEENWRLRLSSEKAADVRAAQAAAESRRRKGREDSRGTRQSGPPKSGNRQGSGPA